MSITSIRIKNYKCFYDSGEVELSPTFNIIVGRNDAGKSAFAEALSLYFTSKPTKILETVKSRGANIEPDSEVIVKYKLSPTNLRSFFLSRNVFYVPAGVGNIEDLIKREQEFVTSWKAGGPRKGHFTHMDDDSEPGLGVYRNRGWPNNLDFVLENASTQGDASYAHHYAVFLKAASYCFRAARESKGECSIAANTELETDAKNLADVLHQLTANPERFRRLISFVQKIFPHITSITVKPINPTTVKIFVWTIPEESERDDLAVSLSESGTGISQVLAILYVVVTSDTPKTIIIDEPQSFLHPGAVRKLLSILRSHPQHQYIITTHSPVALDINPADKVLMVRRGEMGSKIEAIASDNQDALRKFMAEVGVRLGDVFGADSILWVEGKTEEVCFPQLIMRLANQQLFGIQILGVHNTADLTSTKTKFKGLVYDIYARVCKGTTLMPPALSFIFDRENSTEDERRDIERKSGNLVKWLPCRMYENYLVVSYAIEKILNLEDQEKNTPYTVNVIDDWLQMHGTDKKYFSEKQSTIELTSEAWFETVDGANLLLDMFNALTNTRVRYDKVRHGLALTNELIETPTQRIKTLSAFLAGIVKLPPSLKISV